MGRRRREMGVKWKGDVGSFEYGIAATGALLNFTRADLCDPDEEELHGRFIVSRGVS